MAEQFDLWVQSLGVFGYFALGLAALLEFVVPPFPGDTVVFLGGVWVERTGRSAVLTVLALCLGSLVGMVINHRMGLWMAPRLEGEGRLLGLQKAQIRVVIEKLRVNATWLLLVNRFLPSFRAILFIASGAARMPLWKVLVPGLVSALLWNTGLMALGLAVGGNAEKIEGLLKTYQKGALFAAAVLVAAVAGRWWWKRRGQRA